MAAITLQKPAEAQEKTSNFINMCCGCFGAEDAKNKKLSLTDKYKQLPRVGAYNDMQPIFVFSKRWVQPDNKQIYDQFHDQAANYMLTSKDIQNVKMVCHWWDSKNPNMCWDLQWFGDLEAFYQHADMSNQKTKATIMNWVGSSNMDKPYQGLVFGGWDGKVQDMTRGFKADFNFQEHQYGFFREVVGAVGQVHFDAPVIIQGERQLKSGKMVESVVAFNELADYHYQHSPGITCLMCAVDIEDPNLLHQLLIFRDQQSFEDYFELAQMVTQQQPSPKKNSLAHNMILNFQAWQKGTAMLTGHVFCKDAKFCKGIIKEARKYAGLNGAFEYHEFPADSGKFNLLNE